LKTTEKRSCQFNLPFYFLMSRISGNPLIQWNPRSDGPTSARASKPLQSLGWAMNSRYKIIFGCVIFNLFLEYWAHGMSYFLGTWYAGPMLSLLYLTYFSMLEDLIIRYRLRDYQVLNIGFVFGMFHESFNTGSVFGNRAFFGVDLGLVLLVNIGWWGFLQSVLAMYFANLVDAIITAQMILSIIMGTFFGLSNYPVGDFSRNEFAVVILLLWTLLSGITLLTYRMIARKSICV